MTGSDLAAIDRALPATSLVDQPLIEATMTPGEVLSSSAVINGC
jgi:hypothetical protein